MSKGEIFISLQNILHFCIDSTDRTSIIATIVWSNFWKIEPSIFYGPFRSRVVITIEIH